MAPIRQKASGSRRQTPIVRDSGKGTSSKLSYNATPLAPSSKPSTTNSSPLTSTSTRSSRPTGKGSYGRVVLVRTHEDSTIPELPHGAQFAMKAISKKGRHHRQRGNKEPREHSKRIKDSRNAERRFLAELPWHPFINGIMDAFDDDRNLYLMLELAPCESLHKYLRRKRDPIPSAHARFYFSNIVLGLEFLHSRDIWPAGHKANQDLKDLVERMLIPDPAERYGCMVLKGEHDEVGKNDEVRIHPFCYGKVNWKKIMERRQLVSAAPLLLCRAWR
ncbi:hypothetical protein IEO21_07723 [Rhodonia placenta]|uniref:cAMP-dependent protein kinase n=1 Tax=Rhodonia placenta TaxID=104341 RepID=A0A8H7TZX0_9APHY|nr:hypothetical protein IEO21_07723 [Postia placenta]